MMPRGNEHSQWKGGISFIPYPLGWSKTFREQIRYRDGYKCKICDVPEIECKKRLLIHHIDYNKQNINPINLISLCNSCHSKTNWNREYWIKFFDGKIEEVMPKCPQKVL
jgi:5-methylcytosine-specific restriction endonuclease McrA